jgi:hypothetical protein
VTFYPATSQTLLRIVFKSRTTVGIGRLARKEVYTTQGEEQQGICPRYDVPVHSLPYPSG